MNQEKIGKFIASLRKNKKMTQEELAEKMNVSINAVSKWERGLSLPDVSLFKKLCNELGISIEELINGEKDNSDNAKEKAIINTLNENKNIKKKNNIIIIFIAIIFVTIIIIFLDYSRGLNINLVSDANYLYDIVIDYLREDEFNHNPDAHEKDFNAFYSYHGFGIEKDGDYKYVYMWVYNQNYYLEGERSLAIASGSSLAIKAIFKNDNLIKVEYPKDGSYYVSSIKKMFPKVIAKQVLNFNDEKNINKLFMEVENKKNKYYDYLSIDMNSLTIDDISYQDLIFSINLGSKNCIPVQLSVYKNNKYIFHTSYKACKAKYCNSMLVYTKFIEGKYDYDIMEIIKHSQDANYHQYTNDNLPVYDIFTGNGYNFITDKDNKYLIDFLKIINVDLEKCALPDYE